MVARWVRGPVGVSLAAWCRGLAMTAKLGSSNRRIPSGTKNEKIWFAVVVVGSL